MTHTAKQIQPWWRAKFQLLPGFAYTVGKVFVRNRDICRERIVGGEIRLLLAGKVAASEVIPCKGWWEYETGPSSALAVVVADSVEVRLPTTNFLSVAEASVFGGYSPI